MVSLAILCICRCHYHRFPAEFLMAKPFCLTAAKTTWHFHGRWLGRFQVARQSGPDASVMWMSNFHETIIAMDMPLIQETTIFWIFETDFLDDQGVSLKTKILGGETIHYIKTIVPPPHLLANLWKHAARRAWNNQLKRKHHNRFWHPKNSVFNQHHPIISNQHH